MLACEHGYDAIAQLFLDRGADVNLSGLSGISPLHWACKNGHESTVLLLLDKEAEVNAVTQVVFSIII